MTKITDANSARVYDPVSNGTGVGGTGILGIDGNQNLAAMLALPHLPATDRPSGTFARAPERAGLVEMIQTERTSLQARSDASDIHASCILEMGDGWSDPDTEAVVERILARLPAASGPVFSPEDEAMVLARTFYEVAVAATEEGSEAQGIIALTVIPWLGALEAEALCGLAIAAAGRNRLEEALHFAMAALAHPVKNARACCIAGYCELKRGNRRAAQSLLAAASRVARHNPVYREDMRIAQRLLLSLHFD